MHSVCMYALHPEHDTARHRREARACTVRVGADTLGHEDRPLAHDDAAARAGMLLAEARPHSCSGAPRRRWTRFPSPPAPVRDIDEHRGCRSTSDTALPLSLPAGTRYNW